MALLAQPCGELVLEGVAGMIGGEGDAHAAMPRAMAGIRQSALVRQWPCRR